jgi:hypothetical protein
MIWDALSSATICPRYSLSLISNIETYVVAQSATMKKREETFGIKAQGAWNKAISTRRETLVQTTEYRVANAALKKELEL